MRTSRRISYLMKRIFYILDKIPISEIKDLTDDQKLYYPTCNKDEIHRIFNIKTSSDYLLRLRADQIEDNIRLKRVFTSLRKNLKNKWNFTQYFESNLYKTYLSYLPESERLICEQIPHGTIHASEANGFCMKTPHGNIIVLSYALRTFLYYMNVFKFGDYFGIDSGDQLNAFVIAIRTILGKESLDFEIDNRGDIPKEVHEEIEIFTDWQMLFIIGHEYAHHYLGHLESSKLVYHSHGQKDKANGFYNFNQKLELEADNNSVSKPMLTDEQITSIADAAFLFFSYLDLFSCVESYMFPKGNSPLSHPEPQDRIGN